MFSVIFLLFTIVFFAINRSIFKRNANFLNIFWIIFFTAVSLSEINLYSFKPVNSIVYVYILISLIAIELISLIIYKLKFTNKKKTEERIQNLELNNTLLTLIAIIVFALMIPQTINGINIIRSQGLSMLRTLVLTEEMYQGNVRVFLYYILTPISKVIAFFSILDLVRSKKIKLHFIIGIINIVQISLLTAGRSSIFDFLLFLLIVVFDVYHLNIVKILKENKKMISLGALLIIFLFIITSNRKISSDANFFENIYTYFVGSLSLMSIHLENADLSMLNGSHLLLGKGMFSPLFDIAKIFIKFIGFNIDMRTGVQIINDVTQKFYYVSNNIKMNNNVTFLYVCLRDFGILGLLLGPLYISIVYTHFAKLYEKSNKDCYKIAYYYLISLIPYFLFFFPFSNTPTLILFIMIFIFYKVLYKKTSRR